MTHPSPGAGSDRNLLFGILAVQLNFITPDTLLAAMSAWVLDKSRPLGDILERQGHLSGERRGLLETLVAEHLKATAGDGDESCRALASVGRVLASLASAADPAVRETAEAFTSLAEDFSTRLGSPRVVEGTRYRVLRSHARGGLGEVYVAADAELGREVALKEIQARHADSPASRARFVAEAEITGKLEHPGVVPVYGLGAYPDGRPYYAMRFIQGETLSAALRRFHAPGPPDFAGVEFRQLLRRFLDVCNAVAFAHSRGVVHRDLKPGNIMLGRFGETLVVDWGLAKVISRADAEAATRDAESTLRPELAGDTPPTQTGQQVGTPGFMSPEQAAGDVRAIGPASDVYSLGATLYMLLTGRPPVGGPLAEALAKTVAGDYPPARAAAPRVPPALDAICLQAMALRPAARYASPLALAADLERWLADEPVSCHREPLAARAARWGRRHRPWVAGAAALLTTATVGLAVGLWAVSRERDETARALAALSDQQRQTQAALDAESAARRRAADAARRTRAALARVGDQVVVQALARSPRLTAAETRFLRDIAGEYEALAASLEPTPEARAVRIDGAVQLARVHSNYGQLKEAEAEFRRAAELAHGLAAEFPDEARHRVAEAAARHQLGKLLLTADRVPAAEAEADQARALMETILAAGPTPLPEHRLLLAEVRGNLALIYERTHRDGAAARLRAESIRALDELAAAAPGDATYASAAALALTNAAASHTTQRRMKEADAAFADAGRRYADLTRRFPDRADLRKQLVVNLLNRSALMQVTRRLPDAERFATEAVRAAERLANDFPTVTDYRLQFARAYYQQAQVYGLSRRLKEAVAALEKSTDAAARLDATYPDVPEYAETAARALNQLAIIRVNTGEGEQAAKDWHRAAELYDRLAKSHADRPDYPARLGLIHYSLGVLHEQSQRKPDAVAAYRRAIGLFAPLVNGPKPPRVQGGATQANPTDPHAGLAKACFNCANLLAATDAAEAGRLLDQGLRALRPVLDDAPANPERKFVYHALLAARAELALRAADAVTAAKSAAELAERFDGGGDQYLAAKWFAACAALDAKDAKRAATAKGYADRAVALLKSAAAKGYDSPNRFKKDKALDPLRGRADFQALLKRLDESDK